MDYRTPLVPATLLVRRARSAALDPAQRRGIERREGGRQCRSCATDVFDLSTMTSDQAEALLRGATASACGRLYVRRDGLVMASDCSAGRQLRAAQLLAIIAGVTLGVLVLLLLGLPAPPRRF